MGLSECLCEVSSVQLNNKAMRASKGPISVCSMVRVVSLCFIKEDKEEVEKGVRLK